MNTLFAVAPKPSRQAERRKLFDFAFATMPLWETWTKKIVVRVNDETSKEVERGDFKLIPRRKRRAMARDLFHRQYQAAHGLTPPAATLPHDIAVRLLKTATR